ncbi:hypothetical protein LCI18_013915 [Fusarium solani-melongenae]|uniref:Uncharacterized protein n=1 Tax=Fusarium solani subsp. cucurbitae TaxID=2747967 RepID=A0ACD3ZP24_FUSSC|nr:hypothetical protein LCI18_013915 [Fusarium solani-melongenae]
MKLLEGQSLTVPVGSALLLLWLLYRTVLFRFHYKYNFLNLVPGVPLFGNMLQIPTDTAERRLYLHKLAAKYGEMFTLKVSSNYWLFMKSQRVANEILDKRGARYISRQNLPMPGDVASVGAQAHPRDHWPWKPQRICPLQDIESRALLHQYLTEPDLWHLAHARYASSLIMSMVFGRRTKLGDPNVDRIIETNNEIMKMFEPGSNLIDSFPFLASIPILRPIQPCFSVQIARSLIENDSFEGYNLPAGTNVIWNTWGVHMSASEYEQPERFWPKRFLDEDLDKPIKGHLTFGAGCLIASNSLHLLIARVLYCFDFHTIPGHLAPVGKPFDIGTEKPYEIKVTVRSPAHAALAQRECVEAANIE